MPVIILKLWLDDCSFQRPSDKVDILCPDGTIVTAWIEILVPQIAYA
jgi:hypothetical protein